MRFLSFFLLVSLLATVLSAPKVPKSGFAPHIIGGETAPPQSSPYVVSLSASSVAYAHACAGVIIGKQWILTAAHCLDELEARAGNITGLPVYAGVQNRENIADAQKREIDFAFKHKQFNGQVGSDDIALLHVSKEFEFSRSVRYATLPYSEESFNGEASATYGWGLDNADGVSYVSNLQVAKGEVLNPDRCKNVLPENAPLSFKQVCVSISACYGDGGGPLIAERDGWSAVLVGIASWGYVPCGSNRPTVYTNVAEYPQWIGEVQWAYSILFA